jgi:hypothetical protein
LLYKNKIILDENFYNFPFESVKVFRKNHVYFSRMLHANNLKPAGYSPPRLTLDNKVLYVLNPEGDLLDTQKRLETFFKEQLFWIAIEGKEPNTDDLVDRLKNGYAYM